MAGAAPVIIAQKENEASVAIICLQNNELVEGSSWLLLVSQIPVVCPLSFSATCLIAYDFIFFSFR